VRRAVTAALAYWTPRVAPGWTVVVRWGAAIDDPDARAMIDPGDDYHVAAMRLGDDWRDGWPDQRAPGWTTEREIEATVLHELLHLTLRDVDHAAGAAANQLGGQAAELAGTAHTHALEGAIERLARVLVTERHASPPKPPGGRAGGNGRPRAKRRATGAL
jgi:hypothetical protein